MDLVWLQKTWKLLALTCGPLAATSAKHDAKLFALGSALSLLIARMTYTLPSEGATFDSVGEQAALDAVRITSTTNRAVRLVHGGTFLLAAFYHSRRVHAAAFGKDTHADGVTGASRAAQIGWLLLGVFGTYWLCRVGCGFGATGVAGQ